MVASRCDGGRREVMRRLCFGTDNTLLITSVVLVAHGLTTCILLTCFLSVLVSTGYNINSRISNFQGMGKASVISLAVLSVPLPKTGCKEAKEREHK